MQGESKYSTTNINMDCPRTMTIWNYFPGDRDIQEYPHKIKHMARGTKENTIFK